MIADFLLNPLMLRIIFGVVGIFIVFVCFNSLIKKRSSTMVSAAILALIFGVVLIYEAIIPGVLAYLIPNAPLSRIRLIVAILSVYMVLLTFESIRLTQLKEKYALLWLIPCAILIALTCCPSIMVEIRSRFGMEFASQMVAVMFVAMLFAVYMISMTLSKNETKISQIAQRCAILEQRIEQLEKQLKEKEEV